MKRNFPRRLILLQLFLLSSVLIYPQKEIMKIMSAGNSITRGKYGTTYRLYLRPKLDSLQAPDSIDFVGSSDQPPHDDLEWDSVWSDYPEAYAMLNGDIEHESYGGYSIQSIINIPIGERIRMHQPDIVLLLAGTNDMPSGYDGASDRLGILIDSILASLDGFLIVSTIPPKYDNLGNELFQVVLYNGEIPGVVNEFREKGLPVDWVDSRSMMDQDALHADGLHTSVKGNRILAGSFYQGILKVLSQPAPPHDISITITAERHLQLEWIDTSYYSEGYIIERSAGNQENFEPVDTLPSKTNTYTDTTVVTDISYSYRLITFNRYHQSGYSDTISEKISTVDIPLKSAPGYDPCRIYPNPAKNDLYIHFSRIPDKDIRITVKDVTGRNILQTTHGRTKVLKLNLADQPPGIYFIQIAGQPKAYRVILIS
jgi:hypothetical protein